jgi:hypothetical protein
VSVFDGIERVGAVDEPERRGPVSSSELRRVLNLPRRVWDQAEDLERLRVAMTNLLKTPTGTWELQTQQAAALRELYEQLGLFGPVGVGEGKTLITLLAATLMQSKRPLLLVPASLRDQTLKHVLPEMRQHWKIHPNLRLLGYEELSLEKNAKILEEIQPDLIMADECHCLKDLGTGRTKRVSRYMRANPYTIVVMVSGTVADHSLMDYWHLIQWALKPMRTPLPAGYHEVQEWARAIDERVKDEDRLGPGALKQFCKPGEEVRSGYRRRLTETPGVIATDEKKIGVSLHLFGETSLRTPAKIEKLLRSIEDTWTLPDGETFEQASQLRTIRRSLICGFWRRWKEQPPLEWLEARKAWHALVRHVLQYNKRGLDTPKQVWTDLEGRGGCAELSAWKAVKDTFLSEKEVVWVSSYVVEYAAKWLAKNEGICWVEYPALGEAIASEAGVPYFGEGNSGILTASGPVIASIGAHREGKNLQQWATNLIITPPSSGKRWQQLLGRTHRKGQLADTVTATVLVHHWIFKDAMEQAFRNAVYLESTLGNKQRLLYCDTDLRRSEHDQVCARV